MRISVVIPVYNAEKFLRKAVESALEQEETKEVILVEDGSPDGSLKVCIDLEQKNDRVRLFRHPNGQNKGAGPTRTLGIKKAIYEWIAFLDADDYYLPGRFSIAKKIIEHDKTVDGVYEAIGMHFYDMGEKQRWLASGRKEFSCIATKVHPGALFEYLVQKDSRNRENYIHLDGLIVKKSMFEDSGYFFNNLRLHQDTAMTIQLAAVGRLVAGKQDGPVAMRGIHAENRITKNDNPLKTQLLMWETLNEWAQEKRLKKSRGSLTNRQYVESSYKLCRQESPGLKNRIVCLFLIIKRHPLIFCNMMIGFVRQRF